MYLDRTYHSLWLDNDGDPEREGGERKMKTWIEFEYLAVEKHKSQVQFPWKYFNVFWLLELI